MELPNIFNHKRKEVARQHSSTCMCNKCLGLDVMRKEMSSIRKDIRSGMTMTQWIDHRNRRIDSVNKALEHNVIKIVGKDKLEQIKGNQVQKKSARMANDYIAMMDNEE